MSRARSGSTIVLRGLFTVTQPHCVLSNLPNKKTEGKKKNRASPSEDCSVLLSLAAEKKQTSTDL